MDFDLIILGGSVFDGSGSDAVEADVGVVGDSIVAIGDLAGACAKKTLDASGCIVCPGLIDAHSHSDTYLLLEPSAASKIYQGISTEICGNCGASSAPLLGNYKMPADWLDKDYSRIGTPDVGQTSRPAPPPWSTVADYRECFAAARPAINVALLVGHNTLHAGICGYEPRSATPAEMQKMFQTLEQALDEGAIGLSSGLA
jgi:N-acyl-D-amino-acid deacylase